MNRKSGIFLSISSLPSKYGIGSLGEEAYKFVDFVKESGFSYWQILPFNPTGFGNSPYQTVSTFAGNPYYIDLKNLQKEGFLSAYDLRNYKYEDGEFVNYGLLYEEKFKILRKAYKKGFNLIKDKINSFVKENEYWIKDYSLFMAIKDHFQGCSFLDWPSDIKTRKQESLNYYSTLLEDDVNFYTFIQYIFFEQFNNLVKYANSIGIELICDLPIYVSMDSSDAWANTDMFLFDSNFTPKLVAGVPPDYFSKTGQLWGNPLYNYPKMKENNYAWWISRIRHISKYCKNIRIDHFRGFESFYAIKYGVTSAKKGKWIKGPGIELFNKIKEECPEAKIIAEDLGIITRKVRKLIKNCSFPGMKVLQFAFDGRRRNAYLPKRHIPNSVCYIGTHDNQTLKGFVDGLSEKRIKYIKSFYDFEEPSIEELLIRALFESKSNLIIINAIDMLLKDDTYRMNEPSTTSDKNWCFRLTEFNDLFKLKSKYLKLNTKTNRL